MKKSTTKNTPLRPLDPKKAGIDIGSKSVFACISNDENIQEVREFPFFTQDIEEMGKWLLSHGVTSIAMESTGIYWQPLFEILAPMGFELILCNAKFLKNVPGRKTDVKDAQWIQQLYSAGLLSGSFRPSDDIIPFRAYIRKKKKLITEAGRQTSLMYKALRELNILLDLVLSDTTGKTSLAIIKAIIEGERDPEVLASLRQRNVKSSTEEIIKALQGNWRKEHIFELTMAYNMYQYINAQIMLCEEEIKQSFSVIKENIPQDTSESSRKQVEGENGQITKKILRTSKNIDFIEPLIAKTKVDLTGIPGVNQNTALVVIAECGLDMSKFKNSKHFASWLGLCPRNKISGGRILDARTAPSSNRAAQALRMTVLSLSRSQTWLGAYFRRMRAKFGTPKAITATAHKIAVIIYNMLRHGTSYQELGGDYYEKKYKERIVFNLTKKAAALGYTLNPLSDTPIA